eukprot:GDKH01000873.1.p2 GENE.GDKH01000873.1~~GDKH01000873.1.p2  ORF type:complete len:91 (-),score=13.01 GDKH01000873.1:200-472(-)
MGIGDMPPLMHASWKPIMYMGYGFLSMPILMFIGFVCGKGLTLGGTAGVIVPLLMPILIRIVANHAVCAYEYAMQHMSKNNHTLQGGFLQ